MNTTDSAAILEAIHQGGLAKRGINPRRRGQAGLRQEGRDVMATSGAVAGWAGSSILKSVRSAASPESYSEGPSSPETGIPKEDTLLVICRICSVLYAPVGGLS